MFFVPVSRGCRQPSRLFDDTFDRYFLPAMGARAAAQTAVN